MKQQISLRVSDATREKLEALALRYGTKTEAVAVAVDRLYEAEMVIYNAVKQAVIQTRNKLPPQELPPRPPSRR